ncbi:MAG: hypothetical protein FH756_07495 [Firmicutes bacterium]|nr:hypothetical protein [Bacillota bacterium]
MAIALSLVTFSPSALAADKGHNNVIVYWTNGDQLKAVTLTCLKDPPAPVGIVAVPVYASIDENNALITVEDYYHQNGRPALTRHLEKLFGIPIDSYVHVEQDTLERFSDILGPLRLGQTNTSLAEIFEGTYVDKPVNLQWEIRSLAGSMLTPSVILKIPKLVWVYTTEIESNLQVDHVLALHGIIRGWGPEILQKQRVPGQDCKIGNRKYRVVPPGAWSQTLQAVTTPEKRLRAAK